MMIGAPLRRSALLVALAGLFSAGTPPLRAADLAIGHVEITQVLQDDNNSVPLIRFKPTVVRVFPVVSGTPDLPQVSALLHAKRHGVELNGSPMGPSRGTVSAAPAVDRRIDQSALIFELPLDWTSGATEFSVELVPPAGFVDAASANNRHDLKNGDPIEFQQTRPLDIRFLKVRFRNGGPDRLPESRASRQDAVGWLRAIFPLAPEDVRYKPWISTELVFENNPAAAQPDPTQDLDAARLITELNTLWEKNRPPSLLFAWTPTSSFSQNGKSDPWFRLAPFPPGLGRVALGNSNGERYRRTLAHEMAHNLGIKCHHETTLVDDLIGYDTSLSDPAQESVRLLGAASGTPRFDVMKPGETEIDAWIVPWTYKSLIDALTTTTPKIFNCPDGSNQELGDLNFPLQPNPITLQAGVNELLAIRGEVHEGGGSFFPFYEVPAADAFLAAAALVPGDGAGKYEVQLLGTNAEIVQRIRWDPPNDLDDSIETTSPVPFTWFVPKREDIGAVLLLRGDVPLATLVVPQKKPKIEQPKVEGIRKQDTFDGPPQELRTVRWKEVRDGAPGDPFNGKELRHRLWFSNDNGGSWIPVAANLSSSPDGEVQIEVDQSLLPGGPSCLFKVTSSDGYNVTEKISAPFPLPNRPPQVDIISPGRVSTLPAGASLRLVGEVFDPEKGALADDLLQWREGPDLLGTGPVLVLENLAPRRYQIRLTAMDGDGNVGESAAVTVDILETEP